MPRKKSVKQKVSQKVVQTVKVIVGDTGKKRRRAGGRRKPRQEPEVETISSKTLAPVYIQPPVAPPSYPFDMSVMPSVAASIAAQRRAAESSKAGLPEQMAGVFEDYRPKSETLFPTAFEQLAEKDVVVPVAVVVDKLRENPTTSVDSNIPIEESYNVFYDQPLYDTDMAPKKDEFGITLADVDKTPPAYVLDPSRDIAAINSELEDNLKKAREEVNIREEIEKEESKRKYKMRETSAELANDLILYAKDPSLRNMSREAAISFITSKRQELGISAKQFRKMYILSKEKAKQVRDIQKTKSTLFDIQYAQPTDVPQSMSLRIDNPLYNIVQSTTK